VISTDAGSHAPLLASGRDLLWCALEGHEGLGISAKLDVQ
jgi:hypothetical protein